MFGEFTLEDKSGNIIFASSPGMSDAKLDSKAKPKTSAKRSPRRPLIQIFTDLADAESDAQWEERFRKMAMSRFPAKISWGPSTKENSYGELTYKNRQIVKSLEIYQSEDLREIRANIKSFIQNYTNIDMERDGDGEADRETLLVIEKTRIVPVPWSKLTSKDQTLAITDFVRGFVIENSLSKEESDGLIRYLIAYAMGKNIAPLLIFDTNGTIDHIKGLQRGSTGTYKLKTAP